MGIFCFRPPAPSPPDPHPLESPSLSNMVGFPLWEKYFRQKMLLRYTIMGRNLPPPDPGLPLSEFPLPSFGGKIWIFLELGIHHFHRDHKAPYLPPKFCITIVFDSFREDRNTQENWKQWLICKSFGRCTMYGLGDWNGELEKKNKKKNLVLLCPTWRQKQHMLSMFYHI